MTFALYLIAFLLLAINLDFVKYLKGINANLKRLADVAEREEERKKPPKEEKPRDSNWNGGGGTYPPSMWGAERV